jgi:hypothetical protein
MFNDFIWQGNVKIKSSFIVKNLCWGRLADDKYFCLYHGIKITWLKRIISNVSWKSILYDKIDMQIFFHCGNHYFDKLAKETNTLFWKDTFTALSRYIKLIPIENHSFEKHPLFYNNNILIGSKSVLFRIVVRCWCL